MAIALVLHTLAGAGTGGDNAVTGSVDTTGSTLFVACVASFNNGGGGGAITLSDNKSNTWTPRTARGNAGTGCRVQIFDAVATSAGSGHTFTAASTDCYPELFLLAFSGTHASSPFDKEVGTTASSVTVIQAASMTPTVADSMFVSMLMYPSTGRTLSIDLGFTISDQTDPNVSVPNGHEGGGAAYLVQSGGPTGLNPTWTIAGGSVNVAVASAVYKPAVAATFIAVPPYVVRQAVNRASTY